MEELSKISSRDFKTLNSNIRGVSESVADIAESIQVLAQHMDERFEQVDKRFDKIEGRVGRIEVSMVTKSYLDDKSADIKGGMVSMLRKEDQKVNRLICVMVDKGSLTPAETQDVLSFRPFP
ncbi:MAG: hypothetical protein WC641_04620 [Patescibacteria group bacterium]